MCVGAFQRGYVEKNTWGCAVPVADCPKAIGAGFAETGRFFANAMSSRSILRCSCGMGKIGWVTYRFFHSPQGLDSGASVTIKAELECNGWSRWFGSTYPRAGKISQAA
jgi:hypothetical protein